MKLYPRPERGDHSLPALYPTHPHSIPSFLGGGGGGGTNLDQGFLPSLPPPVCTCALAG